MNKKLNAISVMNELQGGGSAFFRPQQVNSPSGETAKPKETQIHAQKDEQVSKLLSEPSSNPAEASTTKTHANRSFEKVTAEDIELMSFHLRKTKKSKVNTEIAEDWKQELAEIAFKLHIGKYELVEYIIGQFLDKLPSNREV